MRKQMETLLSYLMIVVGALTARKYLPTSLLTS